MRVATSSLVAIALLFSLVLTGCDLFGPKTGTVEVRVTDAPTEYEVISITINVVEAAVQKSDGDEWTSLSLTGPSSFDLLQLVGLEQVVASAEVAAGSYSNIRLSIEKMEVALTGDAEIVVVPSEAFTFEQPFEVIKGETTIVVLDFEVDTSVTVTEAGDISIKPIENITVSVRQGETE